MCTSQLPYITLYLFLRRAHEAGAAAIGAARDAQSVCDEGPRNLAPNSGCASRYQYTLFHELISNRESLTVMTRVLQFIDDGDGEILHRYPASAVRGREQ